MATPAPQQNAMVKSNPTQLEKIKAYARMGEIQERFANLLGSHQAKSYIESVIIAVANSEKLQECTPKSIMLSAMRAASLRLSVDPVMKQAHLVPFGNQAQLIVDYHGLVMMMERTGQYTDINVTEVYDGEDVKIHRMTGRVDISGTRKSDNIIGWCAYFRTRNGLEKYLYMTNEECDAHGKKYSKAFESSKSGWQTDRPAMRRKTVLRLLAQRWGHFGANDEAILRDDADTIEGELATMPDDNNITVTEQPAKSVDQLNAELGFN